MMSEMEHIIADVVNWSRINLMNINWNKTKEMIIGPLVKQLVPLLNVDDIIVQRVNAFKLLGVSVKCDLKWDNHVDAICGKAASRLYFLKLLKRSAVSKEDLLHFYFSNIRPILEYSCPVWHTSLNAEQTQRIESIQRRALIIITGYDDLKSYITANNICTLHDRRETLCKMFFLIYFKC